MKTSESSKNGLISKIKSEHSYDVHRLSGGRLSLRKNTTIGFKGDTLFVHHGTGGNPKTG